MTRETIRVRGKGEITLPAEIRQQMGLEVGALLTAEVTDDGVLLRPAEVVARDTMRHLSEELQASGVSLEELMESGRKARSKTATDKYGSKSESKPRRKRS